MVSLNMTRYSLISKTTLLLCVLVVVTGRSVENEEHLPEGFLLDSKIDGEDDVEARYMSSGSGGISAPSMSRIESILKQILSLFEEQGSQQPNIYYVPLSGGSTGYDSTGAGSSGSGGGYGGGYGDDGGSDSGAIVGALIPEIVAAAVSNEDEDSGDTTRRRRRRRRRPASGGNRVRINQRRRPNGRRVFVLGSSNTK